MTKQERRTNLGMGIFMAAVFAGSILNWTLVALLVAAVVVIASILCFVALWAAMDDEVLRKKQFPRMTAWEWIYDLVIMVMLFAGSMSGIGILYTINYVIAAYIRYRHAHVNRIVSSK